ncbi:hypothetical protein BGX28_006773 [Mortierella sp. GBA30]|nr:hypothetical protein BGX28_006773 [Mortierella sp. GBA30]
MDRTRGLDNEAIMRAKHANPLLTAALQLNTSLTRGLADTRRDSAVAIASAEVDLTSSSSRSVSSRNKSYLVPEYREESIPLQSTICTTNSSMQEKIDMQSKQQDPSVDDKDDDIASNIAGDNSDQKKKKKKKKKTKSSSSSTVVDQQQTAEIFQSRTTDPRQVVSSSQQHATPTTSSTDQLNTVGAKQEEHSHNGLTEESLEWLESAVVRGDTKPKGKRSKAKKKPAAKKTTTTLLPHNSSASTSDHDPLDDDEEGVKTLMEINDDDAKADGDDDTSTRLESTVKNFSLAGNNSAVLSHMDDLAFLDDDFLGGGGGSGNWADDVEDFAITGCTFIRNGGRENGSITVGSPKKKHTVAVTLSQAFPCYGFINDINN